MAEILAGYLQANLRRARAERGLGPRIMEHVDPESLRIVEAARRLSWLPWKYVVESGEAVMRGAESEAQAEEFIRRAMRAVLDEPFLRRLAYGGLAIVGRSPERLASWVPTVWRVISRDAGKLIWCGDSLGAGRLCWEGPPEVAMESPLYQRSTAISFLPIFDLAGVPGTCEVERQADSLIFHLRW